MPKTAISPFEQLVKEACEAELELRRLVRPEHQMLSAKGFLASVLRLANRTREQVEAFERTLGSSPVLLDNARAYIRRVRKAIRDREMRGVSGRNFTAYHRTLGAEAANAEVAALGETSHTLFAVAVLQITREFPDVFGSVDDWEAFDARRDAIKAKLSALLRRIPDAVTAADIDFGVIRPDGSTVPTLRISGGSVTLGPRENLGERLVAWAVVQVDTLKALGVQVP